MNAPSTSTPSLAPPPPCVAAQDDGHRWFREEVHAHDGQLKAYLKGKFPGVRDVDDVVQESYFRLWKAKAVRPILSAKSFLFQIARHVAIDLIRHERASPVDPLGDLRVESVMEDGPDAAAALSTKEKLDLLSDALVALPTRCREVIFLHKIKGLSQRKTGERLGISERTVENHTRQGLIRLHQFMRAKGVASFSFD